MDAMYHQRGVGNFGWKVVRFLCMKVTGCVCIIFLYFVYNIETSLMIIMRHPSIHNTLNDSSNPLHAYSLVYSSRAGWSKRMTRSIKLQCLQHHDLKVQKTEETSALGSGSASILGCYTRGRNIALIGGSQAVNPRK